MLGLEGVGFFGWGEVHWVELVVVVVAIREGEDLR